MAGTGFLTRWIEAYLERARFEGFNPRSVVLTST